MKRAFDLLLALLLALVVAAVLAVPQWAIELAAAVLGRRNVAQRLCGSLQVDIEKTRQLLGWKPVVTMDEQLKKMAEHDARI